MRSIFFQSAWVLLALGFSPVLLADGQNSGWSLSLTCSAVGSSGAGAAALSRGAGFEATGTVQCARTSSRFTRLNFTGYDGTEPHAGWYNGDNSRYELFAVHTGDFLITPPILETEFQPIYTVDTNCPTDDVTVNWIFVQWDTAEQLTLEDTYLLGYSDITAGTGASTMQALYDVDGTTVATGPFALPSNNCSNGLMEGTGGGEEDATTFYTSDGSGVYKSSTGRATFFFPQDEVTLTDLGSLTYQGIQFDSLASNGVDDVRQVQVTSNAAGTEFTITPYSDVEAGTPDASFTDTITISQANSPQNGMLLGTVTRTGAGAGGPTKIACITHASFLKGRRVICSGQSPGNANIPYSVTFVETETTLTCPTGYVFVNANPEVGAYEPFCVAKYEMKIVGNDQGDNGPGSYDADWVAESRASGTPWVYINRDQAITECQAIAGGNYDLISNAQWQAVAREIEIAQSSPGVYLNWSNNSITGNEALNRGHSDYSPSGAQEASSNDSDAYYCTNNDGCTNNTSGTYSQKRTHTLLSGDIIWDVAGNVQEWVKDDNNFAQAGNHYISQEGSLADPWDNVSEGWALQSDKLNWGPSGTYTGKNSGEYGGLGYGALNFSAGAVLRGGAWGDTTHSGVFRALLGNGPLNSFTSIGFRCVFVP